PRGSDILISPYTLHRNPLFWRDPDDFSPQRFDGRSPDDLPPFTYMPFSAGPRRCIGDRYALRIVAHVLPRFLLRYRVVLDSEERGQAWPLFTLRPRTGILCRL